MKAIFIAFDEAYYDRIVDKLHLLNCRGFTGWREVQGRGSKNGEPHYATHAWPSCPARGAHDLDLRAAIRLTRLAATSWQALYLY